MKMAIIPLTVVTLVLEISFTLCAGDHADLQQVLHHYETLHHRDISVRHHVTKRRADSNKLYHDKVICLDTLGQHFCLHLSSQRHLFTHDFKAKSIHRGIGGSLYEDITLNPEEFYQGFVENDTESRVSAYWEDEKKLKAKIRTKQDTYIIEPSSRHLPHSEDYSMLAYRASDIKSDSERAPERHAGHCGYMRHGVDTSIGLHNPIIETRAQNEYTYLHNKTNHGRYKRQASAAQVCTVALVADYRFTKNVGDESTQVTAKYLAGVLAEINDIYERTDFGNGYVGVGFEIKSIMVYAQPSTTPDFNKDPASWDYQSFLDSFGREDWSGVCLAHLFTYQAFSDGVQGLGWIASAQSNEVGGICSPVYGNKYYNTAWTSHQNTHKKRILSEEANLVTAHEFGHNWGSPHDPAQCALSLQDGGKHLMYQYAVSGYDPNNNAFSSCSKSSVGSVLRAKAPNCFVARSNSFCGNNNVETDGGEQCDAGTEGSMGTDPCCTMECQLYKDKQCSDANDVCCENCMFKLDTVTCRPESNRTCRAAAKCTGSSGACPASLPLAEGSACPDRGECAADGTCQNLCESKGLISCSCDQEHTACKYCCRASAAATCELYTGGGGPFDLLDGRSCFQGYCKAGVCKKSDAKNTARLWDVIKDFDINKILEWMRNNIVVTTIILSLILYIPLCLIIFCIDRRNAKKEKEELEWHDKDNERLIRDGDDDKIRRTYRRGNNPRSGSRMAESDVSASNINYQPRVL